MKEILNLFEIYKKELNNNVFEKKLKKDSVTY